MCVFVYFIGFIDERYSFNPHYYAQLAWNPCVTSFLHSLWWILCLLNWHSLISSPNRPAIEWICCLVSRATTSRFLPICCSLCNLFSLSTCLWLENLNLLHFHPSTACISDFNNVRQQGLSLFFTTALCLMFRDPVNVNFGRLAHSVNNMTPSLLQLLNWANGEMEINNNSAVASLLPHICTQKAIRFDNESVSVVKAQWLCMHFIKWFVVSCCWANRRTNERFSLLRLSFS